MQIRMTMQREFVANLKADLKRALEKQGSNYSEIARRSGVHTSQVSRICRGQFERISGNVLQICKALEVPMELPKQPSGNPMQRRLEQGVVAIWDKTDGGGARLLALLRNLAELRKR